MTSLPFLGEEYGEMSRVPVSHLMRRYHDLVLTQYNRGLEVFQSFYEK